MGVTFNRYTTTTDGVETLCTPSLPAINAEEISKARKGKKTFEQVPDSPALYIPMGCEGATIKMRGLIKTAANFTAWDAVEFGNLLKVASTTLVEFNVGEYWWVDQIEISRQKGWTIQWRYDITLIRSFMTSTGVLRT